MIKVYRDKTVMKHWPLEHCVDCDKPTRYWATRKLKYPLCLKCSKKPDAGHGAKVYLRRVEQ